MDSIEEALSAIFIGLVVAEFLCKTGRVLQANEVFKECFIILHSQELAIDGSLANTMFRAIYMKIIILACNFYLPLPALYYFCIHGRCK